MSSAEALRRCPETVFVRPRHALYRQYSQAVWACVEEIVPRVERTGIDEGYLDLGTVLDSFAGARRLAEAVQTAVRARPRSRARSASRPRRSSARSPRTGASPAGSPSCPPGSEARFLAPFPTRILPGVGPRAEERLAAAGVVTLGASQRSPTSSSAPSCPARSGGCSATARAASTHATSSSAASASRSRPRRRSSGISSTATRCTRSFGAWRQTLRRTCTATASPRGP